MSGYVVGTKPIVGEEMLARLPIPNWIEQARCAGAAPDAWFPEPGVSSLTEIQFAKTICRDCPVRLDCLEHALARREPHGIWGGLSVEQRQQLLRERRQRKAAMADAN